jgi:hypothetical protein
MNRRRVSPRVTALVAIAVALIVRWLDPDGCVAGAQPWAQMHVAAVFGAIVTAIEIIGGWLGTAAAAVATYLATVVQWIVIHLAIFIKATGAVFAKAWDGLKIVYQDVLKPAVQWFDAHIKRLYAWLRQTFQPVFDFLNRVRGELLDLYRKYVRPVLDIIDYTRAGLRLLGDLGIDWARALDRRLGEVESVISENFRRVLSYINEAIDVLNSIVTADRLFQRLPFLRSLDRDAVYWFRIWWVRQVDPSHQSGTPYSRTRDFPLAAPFENSKRLALFYRGEPTDIDARVKDGVALWRDAANWDEGDLLSRVEVFGPDLPAEGA